MVLLDAKGLIASVQVSKFQGKAKSCNWFDQQRTTMVTLPPIPSRIAKLPRDERNYPVPWFVATVDGKPDFRRVDPNKIVDAIKFDRCWVCGEERGRNFSFVAGPMCGVNRVSSEPPSHFDCALFSVKACPFLTRPKMKRNEAGLNEDEKDNMPGIGLLHNPGVTMIWNTRKFSFFRAGKGLLFSMGEPSVSANGEPEVFWFSEGREATRAEVVAAVDRGFTKLLEVADQDPNPTESREVAKKNLEVFMTLMPMPKI